MLKRTPALAVLFTAVISLLTIFLLEDPARPFTAGQGLLIYCIAFLPALGFAMLLDPNSREAKRRYLKINFYDQSKTPEELVAEMMKSEEQS